MTSRHLVIATALLSLSACGDRGDTATTAANADAGTTASAAGDTVAGVADGIGQSAPANAVQDAVGGVVGQATAAAANSAEAYVTNAALSDMYERESSKLAGATSQSTGVKAFARQMIADHTATTAEVKTIIASDKLGLTPPARLDSRRQGFIDNLKAAPADGFDKVYLAQQVAAHREALTLHRSYADDGDNAALKAFAVKTAPKVQMHLDMVEKLDTAAN